MIHRAAGRIVPMKNSGDTFRNLTRDLPACSTVIITRSILNIEAPLLYVMLASLFLKTYDFGIQDLQLNSTADIYCIIYIIYMF
jgi:hypothetical protein